MQEKYRDKGLIVIGINLDTDINTAKQFIQHVPADFLLYSDPKGILAKQYELIGMPSSYIFSGNGEPSERHVGFKKSNVALYEATIVKLLNQLATDK